MKTTAFAALLFASTLAAGTAFAQPAPFNEAGATMGHWHLISKDVEANKKLFLGMGGKLFATPWSALTLDTENKCFVLNVDKERLDNAPGFDKDKWPDMADQTWADEIHSYYGLPANADATPV